MTKSVDVRQLGRLLDEYAAPLALYASQWTQSPEDCVQEAFVALASQTESPDNPIAWLFRVVRNRALNESRCSQRRHRRERDVAKHDLHRGDPADLTESHEERNRMLSVLEGLQPVDRELIVLRIWSGLSWKEIAKLTGTSSSSAQRNFVAAIKKMRIRLETQCLTKPE